MEMSHSPQAFKDSTKIVLNWVGPCSDNDTPQRLCYYEDPLPEK